MPRPAQAEPNTPEYWRAKAAEYERLATIREDRFPRLARHHRERAREYTLLAARLEADDRAA